MPAGPMPQKRPLGSRRLRPRSRRCWLWSRAARGGSSCEPARKHRREGARRGRTAVDRRPALRQSLGRSGAGLPRRRPDRRTDHRSRPPPRHFRHRAQHGHDLQGQTGRRQGHRQGSGRAIFLEGSVHPSGDQMRVNAQLIDAGSGAHLWAEQSTRPAPTVADAGRDRHASGARDELSTHQGRGRTRQTEARGQSRRRGPGSPMRRGRAEDRR